MRLSRKSSREKSSREMPGGARHQQYPSEVHFASGVLKHWNVSRHNGCDRYIAKTFQPAEGSLSAGAKPDEACAARHRRNRVVTRAIVPV